MKDLLNKLLAFFGIERDETVEDITAPITKIKAKLDAKVARHERLVEEKEAEKKRVEAEYFALLNTIDEDIEAHDDQASRAAVASEKYAALAA